MNHQDWLKIREIFDRAVKLERSERAEYVEQACSACPEILEHVRKLLAADDAIAKTDSGNKAETHDKEMAQSEELPLALGAIVAGFRIGAVIGRGASGVVYEALQVGSDNGDLPLNHRRDELPPDGKPEVSRDQVTERLAEPRQMQVGMPVTDEKPNTEVLPDRVAIKALYPWRFDRDSLLRFDREREAMSRLRHPNVARFFEAGKTSDGVPFLIMERIDGESLQDRMQQLGEVATFPALATRIEWII